MLVGEDPCTIKYNYELLKTTHTHTHTHTETYLRHIK